MVIALGSKTNREMIPGSEHAFAFKTVADACCFATTSLSDSNAADVESDPQRKSQVLTFIIIGGGLVGVELLGEFDDLCGRHCRRFTSTSTGEKCGFCFASRGRPNYPGNRPALAAYGQTMLASRRGVELRTNTQVQAIEPRKVHLAGETIAADTIVLVAGVVPNQVVADLPINKNKRGCILVGPTNALP